jgi:hypothetical protein
MIQVIKAHIKDESGKIGNTCYIPVNCIVAITPYLENMYTVTLLGNTEITTKFKVASITATIMPDKLDVINK